MSNLANLEFVGLDISGKNYLSWALDVEMHLNAKGLGETIKESNDASIQDRAKAMIFIRHHLDQGLKDEYLTVKEPLELWKMLKERYDHQRTVILPKARYDWIHLRLQDFKTEKHGNPPKNVENACYRCGMTGHWEHTCRTARHLVDLYQASLKEKGKNIESNNVLVNDDFNITYLDVEDFLGPIEKKD
nr:uncharacterized protein LOC109176566 [Ipomoea trifida]